MGQGISKTVYFLSLFILSLILILCYFRSSSTAATQAFAVATAGSANNPKDLTKGIPRYPGAGRHYHIELHV